MINCWLLGSLHYVQICDIVLVYSILLWVLIVVYFLLIYMTIASQGHAYWLLLANYLAQAMSVGI